MYDFANSSFTTAIVTVYYAQYFPGVIVGDGPDYKLGNWLWSVTLSASYLLAVFTLPLLGAWMDAVGHKKRFLLASTVVTVVATIALGCAGPGAVVPAMLLVIVANYGFSIGESFVASFLPDLGPPESLGRISGAAWSLGYVGGLLSTALVLLGLGPPEAGNGMARFAGPVIGAWFALASIPTFLLVREPPHVPTGRGTSLVAGFRQLAATARELGTYRDLAVFLISYLFAMAGLSIVISFAFIYGSQVIHWSAGTQALMFGLTQVTATVGALGFGFLQSRIGDKRTYAITLVLWCFAVGLIWGTPYVAAAIHELLELDLTTEQVFLGVGAASGLCIGATQSAGRTIVALLSPPSKVGEFFGLWGVFGKLAAVGGLMTLGLIQALFGLERGILVTGVFFLLGLITVSTVDMARGRASASRPDPATDQLTADR
jgi:UMF1 family MFS transporter